MNKTIEELRDYLLENYVNEIGDLDISHLDFSDFEGDIVINKMKVKGNLHQDYQDVKGNLWQGSQNVGGDLWQSYSTTKGNYSCIGIKVGGLVLPIEPTKLLKKITRKELAEMGYEVIWKEG